MSDREKSREVVQEAESDGTSPASLACVGMWRSGRFPNTVALSAKGKMIESDAQHTQRNIVHTIESDGKTASRPS